MKRFSQNRQAILECLRSTTIHPSADWILEQLRPSWPNLNLATVYRNLLQLKEDRLIRSMGVVAGQEHYDGNIEPHAHVMCKYCGRIVDIPLTEEMSQLMALTGSDTGFEVQTFQFTGLCPDCRRSSK